MLAPARTTPRDTLLGCSPRLVVRAICQFVLFDAAARVGLKGIRAIVVRRPTSAVRASADVVADVTTAVNTACAFYLKPVHCLQRSVAVTRMLRARGFAAQLVIGHQPMPVRSHAWVELDGRIISDEIKDRMAFYHVIDRW